MKIMGLTDLAYVLSWFMIAFLLFFWIALSFTAITKNSFLTHSSSFLVFVLYFLFCMSEITFSFLLSTLFSNSKLAAIAAPVVLFCSILPRYVFLDSNPNELVTQKVHFTTHLLLDVLKNLFVICFFVSFSGILFFAV